MMAHVCKLWMWIGLNFWVSQAEATPMNIQTPYLGTFTAEVNGGGHKAVIFVHGENESAQHMQRVAEHFATPSIQTVYWDLPGFGTRSEEDPLYPLMHIEVQALIRQLRVSGVRDVQCVGSGFGGILCMQALSKETPLSQIAIIDPVHTKYNQSLLSNVEAYSKLHPIFVILGSNAVAEHAVGRLEEQREVLLFSSTSKQRGMSLLTEDPALETQLGEWIHKRIPERRAPPVDTTHELTVDGERLPF